MPIITNKRGRRLDRVAGSLAMLQISPIFFKKVRGVLATHRGRLRPPKAFTASGWGRLRVIGKSCRKGTGGSEAARAAREKKILVLGIGGFAGYSLSIED